MIIGTLRHNLLYETLENFLQRITIDTKNEPTLVNCSQLQAGTALQQHTLEQTLINDNWYLAFVKSVAISDESLFYLKYNPKAISDESFETLNCSSKKKRSCFLSWCSSNVIEICSKSSYSLVE